MDEKKIPARHSVSANENELTRAVIEASPIPYVLFDENLQAIDCNRAAMRVLACPDKQYLLDHYWECFVPESQPGGGESLGRAAAMKDEAVANKQVTFEWVQRTLSGDLIPMENTLTPVVYEDRKYFISFKYDLRQIKKMMKSLNEQRELLKVRLEQQELISEISRGFISSGDTITYIKEALAKMGQYNEVSFVSILSVDFRHCRANLEYHWPAGGESPKIAGLELFHVVKSSFPETLPECATLPVISCGDVTASTVTAFKPLLSVNINAFICAPLYVEGRLWGILGEGQRFTSRRWTESEKSFAAVTASTIAGIIMRDIFNASLKAALRKATEASRAKGAFLSNMSHEMRTPLNAIIGMTAIGRGTTDIENKDYALDKIDNASAHLLGVINDVLDMSKIEANMLELSPVEFNFEKMLQRVVNVVNFRVEEKHQKFTVFIDRQIPEYLIGDDQRIAQVITNLLGNSVKFTPENGSISLDTRFLGEENGLCTVQISVSDTGIGISKEQQERVFSSFEQAESSTTRKYGGTGLGLAISKNIVEMMGGRIWIDSEPEKGATFAFTIQAKRGEANRHGLLASGINLSNVRIMAIDDDADVLAYISEIVQRFGASCDIAESGKEALRLVEENGPYNIYFVDWKMPDINGIELTTMMKAKASVPRNTVVVMISAAEWSAIEADAKKAGVDKFLSKPLFPSTIVDIVGECLGMNHNQAEPPPDCAGSFAGRRILLVEDVEINREIVVSLLKPTLLEIDCAENGVQAVRMFKETPQSYDLIFMDAQMPEMDGYEATRRIRRIEAETRSNNGNLRKQEMAMEFPRESSGTSFTEGETRSYNGNLQEQIPIIAMTANVFREDIERCLAAGMNDHIGKPLDFDIVLGKLRAWLPR